jgi:hypothetical protein
MALLALALVAAAALVAAFAPAAGEVTLAVRCDSAQSGAHFRSCVTTAIRRTARATAPGGRYCGLNVIDTRARCFRVLKVAGQHFAWQEAAPEFITAKLSLLSQAYRLDVDGFQLPREYTTDQSILSGGPHDPVRVSVDGQHSSDRGRMDRAVERCLSDLRCIEQIDAALALRVEASARHAGAQLPTSAGLVDWRYFPAQLGPPAVVWFCHASDCARYHFANGGATFKETRAGRGAGAGFGNPDRAESLAWASADAQDIWAGMRRAGYPMTEEPRDQPLLCRWVDGVLQSCGWVDSG